MAIDRNGVGAESSAAIRGRRVSGRVASRTTAGSRAPGGALSAPSTRPRLGEQPAQTVTRSSSPTCSRAGVLSPYSAGRGALVTRAGRQRLAAGAVAGAGRGTRVSLRMRRELVSEDGDGDARAVPRSTRVAGPAPRRERSSRRRARTGSCTRGGRSSSSRRGSAWRSSPSLRTCFACRLGREG